MPPDHSRRSLLASLGSLALAGCVSDSAGDGTTTKPMTAATSEQPTTTGRPETPDQIASSWPMPAADPGRSNYVPDATGPTEPVAELWRTTASASLSKPVLAEGVLYVGGDDGTVRALDARTGETRWQQSVGSAARTPWLYQGQLFVPTSEAIVVLAAGDGAEQWRVETPDCAAMLVAAHGVYWLSRGPPTVVALAPADGSERWRTELADPWEPPLLAGEDAVFVSSGTYDTRFWRLAADTGSLLGEDPSSGADFPAEQCYRDGTVFAVEGFFGGVRATSVRDDGNGWRQVDVPPAGGGAGGLSVGAEYVFYTSNYETSQVFALSRTDGTVAWTAAVGAALSGRPVVAGEAVLVRTKDGLRCLDPADGTERWTESSIGSDASVVVADDLLFTTQADTVRALRPV
ncbi:PQQ-binding-like beta-propeller repeat protein [Haloarchaeobius sp. HME9146]|uniref:outer membrane protein assembly factor BamB family protein n=1 Tax=Haloarchaeobius sp. HME9146 TaxID=2978732 RepID=UPI0021BF0F38|nr:PQQ-binding-like beta-propeller repeat protein [Haloarchaeobius sp. HME9146]MCT9095887.1 PQQ-binding-like beta-propeller repeat protein [Haloarchaeobius sp. HME9146]